MRQAENQTNTKSIQRAGNLQQNVQKRHESLLGQTSGIFMI